MIRGDDAVYSLMEQMSGNGGTNVGGNDTKDSSSLSAKTYTRIRLVAEIDGYGQSEISCPESGLNGNIWNPYVNVNLLPAPSSSTSLIFLPTNPLIEVFRRRAYERFKKDFCAKFHEIAASTVVVDKNSKEKEKAQANAGNTNFAALWKNLPAHSILERCHFASKLEESIRVMRRVGDGNATSVKHSFTGMNPLGTSRIQQLLISGKKAGVVMDPILLTLFPTDNVKQSRTTSKQKEPSQPTLQRLLINEVKFQFQREWKKTNKGNKHSDTLLHDFFHSNKFNKRCYRIAREFVNIALKIDNDFLSDLGKEAGKMDLASSKVEHKRSKKGTPKISQGTYETKRTENDVNSLSVTYSGLSFCISEAHFKKLQILFDRNNMSSKSLSSHKDLFSSALFSLLARYDMLEGAGLQSSLNGNVFEVLLKNFDCKVECFASPFNCRYERYCSAFPDVDTPYGSLGSFFDFDFGALHNGGCFQANPPFAADFILSMYTRMEKLLTSDSIEAPLMFIVFIPAWRESIGWKALEGSCVLSHHLLLCQEDNTHYYCEGTQHRRLKERYRVASFDTSVFFLQNSAAQKKWPIINHVIDELKNAFGSNPDEKPERSNVINAAKRHVETVHLKNEKASKRDLIEKHTCSEKRGTEGERGSRKKHNNKGGKRKKKFVSDDACNQLEILSSLGIDFGGSKLANKNTQLSGKSKSFKNSKKKQRR